jgi:hypothetical protein
MTWIGIRVKTDATYLLVWLTLSSFLYEADCQKDLYCNHTMCYWLPGTVSILIFYVQAQWRCSPYRVRSDRAVRNRKIRTSRRRKSTRRRRGPAGSMARLRDSSERSTGYLLYPRSVGSVRMTRRQHCTRIHFFYYRNFLKNDANTKFWSSTHKMTKPETWQLKLYLFFKEGLRKLDPIFLH